MKLPSILHPLAFTLYSVLFVYYANMDQMAFSEIFAPIVVLIIIICGFTKFFQSLFKNPHSGAFLSSAYFILTFSLIARIIKNE